MDLKCFVIFLASVSCVPEKMLVSVLMENYRQVGGVDGRPVMESSRPLEVNISLIPLKILFFSRGRTLRLVAWFTLSWKDTMLSWESSQYFDMKQVSINREHVWTPDIIVINSIPPTQFSGGSRLAVDSNGDITWTRLGTFRVLCGFFDLTKIMETPQSNVSECWIHFASFSLSAQQLKLRLAVPSFLRQKKTPFLPDKGETVGPVYEVISAVAIHREATQPWSLSLSSSSSSIASLCLSMLRRKIRGPRKLSVTEIPSIGTTDGRSKLSLKPVVAHKDRNVNNFRSWVARGKPLNYLILIISTIAALD